MDAKKLATIWARNRVIIDEWMDDYCARTGVTRDDVIEERKARWVHDESGVELGTYEGYELHTIHLGGGEWRYTVMTPWSTSEGLCDTPSRDDGYALRMLHEVNSMLPEAMVTVKAEREGKRRAQAVSDAAKGTSKRTVRPKDEPNAEKVVEKAHEEPKVAPRRGRGRPKGSKDSRPRTRRTKAQLIADANRIIADLEAKRERDGQTPATAKKTPKNGSQKPTGPLDLPQDESGSAQEGKRRRRMTDEVAWTPNDIGSYDPRPIWTDGEHEYIMIDRSFVPVPPTAVRSGFGQTPARVAAINYRHSYLC